MLPPPLFINVARVINDFGFIPDWQYRELRTSSSYRAFCAVMNGLNHLLAIRTNVVAM